MLKGNPFLIAYLTESYNKLPLVVGYLGDFICMLAERRRDKTVTLLTNDCNQSSGFICLPSEDRPTTSSITSTIFSLTTDQTSTLETTLLSKSSEGLTPVDNNSQNKGGNDI